MCLAAVKLSIIRNSETDIGSPRQSRIVRVILVKCNGQHAVCIKMETGVHLIGLALVYDIDFQRTALFFKDLDARRHLIGERPAVIKLIG